jgi:hypothetical protein
VVNSIELPIQESWPASEMIESLGSSVNSSTGMVVPTIWFRITGSLRECGVSSKNYALPALDITGRSLILQAE